MVRNKFYFTYLLTYLQRVVKEVRYWNLEENVTERLCN